MSDQGWESWTTKQWLEGLREERQEAINALDALVYERSVRMAQYHDLRLTNAESVIEVALMQVPKNVRKQIATGKEIASFVSYVARAIANLFTRAYAEERTQQIDQQAAEAHLEREFRENQNTLLIGVDIEAEAQARNANIAAWQPGLMALRHCLDLLTPVEYRRVRVAETLLNLVPDPHMSLRKVLMPLAQELQVDIGSLFKYCREADKARLLMVRLRECIRTQGFQPPSVGHNSPS
jgi:hypothetical protein